MDSARHRDRSRMVRAVHPGIVYDIDRDNPEEDWHVPFEQMIYVGDGDRDLPALDFMECHAATANGVHRAGSPDRWSAQENMRNGREATVLKANHEPESGLATALETAGRRAAPWTSLLRTYPHRT